MKKKNLTTIKWLLAALILLLGSVYGTDQALRNIALSTSAHSFSQSPFIQFLENIFGMWHPKGYFGDLSNTGPGSAFYHSRSDNTETLNSTMQKMGHSNSGANVSGSLNPNAKFTDASRINSENDRNDGDQIVNAESNSIISAEGSLELNAENNANTNAELNAENPQGNSEANNGETNSELNTNQGTGNNSGSSTDQGSDGFNNSGNSSPGSSGDNSGNASQNSNQANLPTLNTIPSDTEVSQDIAQTNQHNAALEALLASRQQLVVPVQQQAQADKYQNVTTQNIQTPSTNQAPSDIVQKVQSRQLNLH